MILCPVALAVGCKKCPIFKVCPVKGIIGDYKKEDPAPAKAASARPANPKRASAKPASTKKTASNKTRSGGKRGK